MAASGAQYGMLTTHFYWVGAIIAMVFLAIFMMPFYYGSKAKTAPEYLKLRFDEKTRAFNSVSFAVMTICGSGISMHALAFLLETQLGWNYHLSLVGGSIVVMLYIFKGGLTSAIYTEVVQFFLIVFGFAPVVYLGLKEVGGWDGLTAKLKDVGTDSQALGLSEKTLGSDAWTSMWSSMGNAADNSMGVSWIGLVFGLGFVLSFGYWCTNFLVVQRAMAANSMRAARNTPIIATIPKMIFPLLVIVPGLIAVALEKSPNNDYKIYQKEVVVTAAAWSAVEPELKALDAKLTPEEFRKKSVAIVKGGLRKSKTSLKTADGNEQFAVGKLPEATSSEQPFNTVLIGNVAEKIRAGKITSEAAVAALAQAGERNYNDVITSLLNRYCPTGLLGLALTALLASFMSGMAGNVSAFNSVWTYDIYQAYIKKDATDGHYKLVGKLTTVVGIVLSIGFAYVAKQFNNIMDLLQLVFGFVNAPIFAAFLLGMFWKRATGHGAFFGVFAGTIISTLFYGLTTIGDGSSWFVTNATTLNAFPSGMTQNFWLAISSFSTAAIVITAISLVTKRTKEDKELVGLVYSLTPKQHDEGAPWYARPALTGAIILAVMIALNIYFR
jgi:SSS family solute:Na+ symporter